jgi:hypothetical protein
LPFASEAMLILLPPSPSVTKDSIGCQSAKQGNPKQRIKLDTIVLGWNNMDFFSI